MTFRRPLVTALTASLGAIALSTSRVIAAPAADADRAASSALLARYMALKNAHDASRCGDLYLPDYIEHSGRNPSGIAALVANWTAQFTGIPDVQLTLEDQVIAGDRVVARITYSGTHTRPFLANIPPTGKRFAFATIDIWRVAGGKFAEHWDVVDFAGLTRQLQAA